MWGYSQVVDVGWGEVKPLLDSSDSRNKSGQRVRAAVLFYDRKTVRQAGN
jgi:hypothetical protein